MEKPQYGQQLIFDEIEVIDQRKTAKSEIKFVKTRTFGDVLFMDGEVQLSTMDEHRYHEQLVHPLMCRTGGKRDLNVLVIGGGDGCAVREILKWEEAVASVTVVDYDDEFVQEYGKGRLSAVNNDAFNHPAVSYICQDAVSYLQREKFKFDVIFIDLPDPDGPEMVSLYYDVIKLAKTRFSHGIAMHVGPAIINPESPQRKIITELKALLNENVGFHRVEMGTCHVPSFSNDWAFLYLFPTAIKEHDSSSDVSCACKYWHYYKDNDFNVPKDLMLA
jgi:predicted membrane-bound spermidine synthase